MPKDPLNTSEFKDIPAIPPGLIDALERRFPSKCPDISDSERVIFHYAGQVSMIQWLKSIQIRRQHDQFSSIKENITNV